MTMKDETTTARARRRVFAATAAMASVMAITASLAAPAGAQEISGARDVGGNGKVASAKDLDWTEEELADLRESLAGMSIKGPRGDLDQRAGAITDAIGDIDFEPGDKYAALGDSYSAMGSPFGSLGMISNPAAASCVRSDDGLGPRVAELLEADLINVACSGALPVHYWKAQTPATTPQADAITPDVKLVTMTMGGNKMIPASMLNPLACGDAILKAGNEACEKSLRDTGVADELIAIWRDMRAKAPDATLVAVGYLQHDLDQGLVPIYNKIVKEAAERADVGVRYVDPGFGMDLTGGLMGGYGMHPSLMGQAGAADAVAVSLGREPKNKEAVTQLESMLPQAVPITAAISGALSPITSAASK